jgi:hypothetical protein
MTPEPRSLNESLQKVTFRYIAGAMVLILVSIYIAAVMRGLPKENRIDGPTLGIAGIGAVLALVLFKPSIFSRIKQFEIAGWKVEIEQKQLQQDKQLQDIELILAVLLTDAEQKHLLNLENNRTANYEGSDAVHAELRKLASINLIRRRPGRNIGDIGVKGKVDLADFVKLTDTGMRLAERIKQLKTAQEAEQRAATHA